MKKPTNTTQVSKDQPAFTLLTTGFPGGIERQEARGQAELAASNSLPTECSEESKKALIDSGVVFGEAFPDDPLFCPVTLPEGWQIKPTEHAMHSDLVDAKGRVRASIFYKAAYYDRRADLNAKTRYKWDSYAEGSTKDHRKVVAKDGDTIIHEVGEYLIGGKWEEARALDKLAQAWLDEHYPQWTNPAAYWED